LIPSWLILSGELGTGVNDRPAETNGWPELGHIGEKKEICQGQPAHIQLWISIHLLFGLTFA
jgi:hypothetical protein